MPSLWADDRAVRQIVLNLLTNAIKFTPQGGRIAVKVGWTIAGGQYVSVKDTGPGIPDEEIPLIMSSFGRGSVALQNACEGSGTRPAHRQGAGRVARRRLHPALEIARGNGSGGGFPARARDERPVTCGAGGKTVSAERPSRHFPNTHRAFPLGWTHRVPALHQYEITLHKQHRARQIFVWTRAG